MRNAVWVLTILVAIAVAMLAQAQGQRDVDRAKTEVTEERAAAQVRLEQSRKKEEARQALEVAYARYQEDAKQTISVFEAYLNSGGEGYGGMCQAWERFSESHRDCNGYPSFIALADASRMSILGGFTKKVSFGNGDESYPWDDVLKHIQDAKSRLGSDRDRKKAGLQ